MLQRCLHKALCGCDSEVYPLVEDLVDCEINSEILKGKNMSMISEMVVRLRKLADQWRHNDVAGCNLIDDAANTIEELSAKVRNNNLHGGWIPVSERLPENSGCVLISIAGDIEFGAYDKQNSDWAIWRDGYWDEGKRADAWMPLPEPYREDDDE